MAKLNPNAQKWVEALRSGKYKQGKNRLRTGNTFCCLGVACDVFKSQLKLRWRKRVGVTEDDLAYSIGGKDADLPVAVQSLIGLKTSNGSFSTNTLAWENDYGNLDLEGIAALIEEHAEELGICEKTA